MRFKRFWGLLLLTAMALGALLSASVAAAAPEATVLTLTVPDEGTVGEESQQQALLTRENGQPIAGAQIELFRTVEYANLTADLKVGEAVTDSRGIATLRFSPRAWGEQRMVARFAGDSALSAAETSSFLLVSPGPQVHTEEAGLKIPFFGAWFLAAVLGTVWGLFAFVAVQLIRTARAGASSLPYWEKR